MLNWTGWTAIIIVVAAVAIFVFGMPRLEGTPPRIDAPAEIFVGKSGQTLRVRLTDTESGLRRVEVRVRHAGGGKTLAEFDYPGSVLFGGSPNAGQDIEIPIDPAAQGLRDGTATLVVTARDWSLRDAGKGNRSEASIRLEVDTQPPRVRPDSKITYIYRGGSAVIVYRASEPLARDGIQVDDNYYRGFPLPGSKAPDTDRVSFFAVPVKAPADARVRLVVEDRAGNRSESELPVKIFERRFPEERLNLSSRFFENVIPPLARKVGVEASDPVAAFQRINRDVRAENETRIRDAIRDSHPEPLWRGAFMQLGNSKVMSRFAEQRRYFTAGKEISQATHYGFDLASTKQASITAANRGRVVFAGDLGIYGNCILVDHGLGLVSLYAHLTNLAIEPGDLVEAGQELGRSGASGLAGGDHLHFAILVGETYVDPLEWWDPRWVENHVTVRLSPSAP